MATANIAKFQEIIKNDPSLQKQLKGVRDQASYIKLFVELGAKNGCKMTQAEIESGISKASQGSDPKAATKSKLGAVAGGAKQYQCIDCWTSKCW